MKIQQWVRCVLSLAVSGAIGVPVFAQPEAAPSSDGIWSPVAEDSITVTGERVTRPRVYRTFRLNKPSLDTVLAGAPMEFAAGDAAAVVLSLPLPDGSYATFRIEEAPMLEPALAARFPEIKTYRGQGVDDPTLTTRFGWTERGFHAIILGPAATSYVDLYALGDLTTYIAYEKAALSPEPGRYCLVDGGSADLRPASLVSSAPISYGTVLRTYRLAMAATGEYTQAVGGTTSAALSAIVTTMNRVNGIYERGVAVTMTLIANTDDVIYTNGATDPYTNSSGGAMLTQNQTNLDSEIGTGNYDIGHVFSTGGGGVATLWGPCNASTKGRGVTGRGDPTGDAFDVDYVAHEIGHQFGGTHTFNGCEGASGNRTAASAYEPGSGTTIMAYAGICGNNSNLQWNSDDHFHIESLIQMSAFVADSSTGGACPVVTSTGNAIPTVDAGADYSIPALTPFTLTATGADTDGDTLTYNWEQYDLGAEDPPHFDNGEGPLFRSRSSTASASRTLPSLTYILNSANSPPLVSGGLLTGEVMPTASYDRDLTFQVTARDNQASGGGVASDSMTVTVDKDSGPFAVTSPNTAVTYAGGSTQTVTWDVAGTTGAPVSATAVSVLYSSDGGTTFGTTLLASTTNDGSADVTMPASNTTTARIKVVPVGNIFFDVSDADFTIEGLAFTDPTLTTGSTQVKAIHISELRTRIDALRLGCGLGGYSFTDPTLTTGTTTAKVSHITDLRTALDQAYTACSVTRPTYTDASLTAGGTAIKAVHITELREAVIALE